MNTRKSLKISLLILALGCCFLPPLFRARAQTEVTMPVPAIVQKGFSLWAKNREASWAFDAWKIGGLLERDNKPITLTRSFTQMDINLGPYKSFDLIQSKRVSQNSAVLYLAVNFERAAMYGRFMLYRTDADWVVQNMDFNSKPEALMPWLAFDAGTTNQ